MLLRPSSYVGAALSATSIGAEHGVFGAQLVLGGAASAARVVADVGERAVELGVAAIGEDRAEKCRNAARAILPDRVWRALCGDADYD